MQHRYKQRKVVLERLSSTSGTRARRTRAELSAPPAKGAKPLADKAAAGARSRQRDRGALDRLFGWFHREQPRSPRPKLD